MQKHIKSFFSDKEQNQISHLPQRLSQYATISKFSEHRVKNPGYTMNQKKNRALLQFLN